MKQASKTYSLKTAFIDQYSSLGGGQYFFLELIDNALKTQQAVTALIPRSGSLEAEVCKKKVRIRTFTELKLTQGTKTAYDFIKIFFHILYFIVHHGFFCSKQDLLYVNGMRMLPHILCVALLTRTKFCLHIHLEHKNSDTKIIQLAMRSSLCLCAFVPSKYLKDRLTVFLPTNLHNKVHVVENGLRSNFKGLSFKKRFTNPLQHVGIIGRLSPEKGQDILYVLAPKFAQIQFHLIGDTDFAEKEWAKELQEKLPKNVVFHGKSQDIPSLIDDINVQMILVSSRCNEAFGFAAIEAMALSCFTVVRNKGGLVSIAENTGAYTFMEDEEVLLLIESMLKTPIEDLNKIAQAQHEKTIRHYAHEIFSTRLQQCLESTLSKIKP